MSDYYGILTTAGAAVCAQSIETGLAAKITTFVIGDGNGSVPQPKASQTELVHTVDTGPLNSLAPDKTNPSILIAEVVLPASSGPYWIREMGIKTEDGTLVAVCSLPPQYKVSTEEGAAGTMVLKMNIIFTEGANVTLIVDDTAVLATRQYVDDAIDEHEKSRNHPDGTTAAKGFVQLSSATNSDSETLAATPKAVKAAMEVASAAVKSVDNLKPDDNGNVDTGRGDTSQPVIKIPPVSNGNSSYLKIATIKDCGSSSGYFQISVSGSGNYGRSGQSIETITVSCRGVSNMKSTNIDTYINHKSINNGSDSPLRIAAAPTANPGEFHIYLNASGGWWNGVKMRVETMAGGGTYITGAVVDRYMGANAWTTAKPANSFLATRAALLNSGDTGTSGAKIPRLNTANTWSEKQSFTSEISVGTAEGTSVINLGESSQIIRDNGKKGLIITSNSGTLTDAGTGIYLRPRGSTDGAMEMHGNSSGWVTDKLAVGTLSLSNALTIANGGTGANTVAKARTSLGSVPTGVPVPWPTTTAPTGWLKCNGATFDKTKYPELAVAYPTGKLPDLRGEFIRGLDDGRGVDSGRTILSAQDGTLIGIDSYPTGYPYGIMASTSANDTKPFNGDALSGTLSGVLKKSITGVEFSSGTVMGGYNVVAARPRNVAFNYIVRAA